MQAGKKFGYAEIDVQFEVEIFTLSPVAYITVDFNLIPHGGGGQILPSFRLFSL